ncbi:MAG: PHP domain-containing protein [Clostridia bacterium]|nr:PHP domain-containing protein [Clostridia bacterium]
MSDISGIIDLHMHTTFSDGSDTPEELIGKVKVAGIALFSVTDHDTAESGTVVHRLLRQGDPSFITGLEFSCKDENGKYHILGYGFDPESAPMKNVVKRGHDFRMAKLSARLDFLKKEFGFSFPDDEIQKLFSMNNPGKPHIGNLMVKLGYAPTKDEAIKKYIDRMRFEDEYVRPNEAIEGILGAGGIPVLAHPFYGSGDELILGDDMESRLRRLIGYGLCGIEAFYSGFSEKLRREAVLLSEKYDLFVTAGSDYHGKNKLVKLGDTGLDGAEYPKGLLEFLKQFDI